MTTPKYFVYPFATGGDLASIPDATQPSGSVSYNQGYGPDYSLAYSNPAALDISRTQFNQLMNDITGAIQQIQQNGIPYFITSAMNDGSPFSYSKNAIVYQPSDGNVYQSLINANTDTPPTSNWQIFGSSTSLWLNFSADTGGANAFVVAPSPPITAYAAGQTLILKPAFASTGACTINVNGLGAISVKTLSNQDPAANALIPTGMYILSYNATTGCFVVCNPSLPITAAISGKIVYPNGLTEQWGFSPHSAGNSPTITFPTAFSGTPYNLQVTPNTQYIIAWPLVISSTGFTTYTIESDLQGGATPCAFFWRALGPT